MFRRLLDSLNIFKQSKKIVDEFSDMGLREARTALANEILMKKQTQSLAQRWEGNLARLQDLTSDQQRVKQLADELEAIKAKKLPNAERAVLVMKTFQKYNLLDGMPEGETAKESSAQAAVPQEQAPAVLTNEGATRRDEDQARALQQKAKIWQDVQSLPIEKRRTLLHETENSTVIGSPPSELSSAYEGFLRIRKNETPTDSASSLLKEIDKKTKH